VSEQEQIAAIEKLIDANQLLTTFFEIIEKISFECGFMHSDHGEGNSLMREDVLAWCDWYEKFMREYHSD
jgi:hypothetical protein